MKGAFKFLWRVVASVWMPPVALVGIVLAIFVEMDTSSCVCSRMDLKIAAVRIREGGVLSFEDNYRDDCGLDDVDGNGVACNLFDDSESAVFGDGVSARYVAAAVVVNSNCRISLVAACVRRLNEAGFHYVFVLYT